MKKILSVLLVLCMMVSLCATFAIIPSFAEGNIVAWGRLCPR